MNEQTWSRWVIQTARTWDDLAPIIKETGISSVDHEHRQLAEYMLELNEMVFKMEKGFDLLLVEEEKLLLEKFINYAQLHFHNEEAFIKKYNLPGLETQMKEHRFIMARLRKILFEFQTGRISSIDKIRIDLLNWIINHINQTDYEVFDFFNICDSLLAINSWNDISGFIRNLHIPPIDYDHKRLTEAIMELGKSIQLFFQKSLKQNVSDILEKLDNTIRLTKYHFVREQDLIKKYNIGGLDVQLEQHSGFLQYLSGQKDLLLDKQTFKLAELEQELIFWWIQHINIYDYTTFCKTSWIKNVFRQSSCSDEVLWLLSRTGIKEIDHDHIGFISKLFKLEYLINGDQDRKEHKKERLQELDGLIEYARMHFAREEKIMQETLSGHFDRHLREHQRILDLLKSHKIGLENELIDTSLELREKLLHWWIDHTNGIDFETFGAVYEDQ